MKKLYTISGISALLALAPLPAAADVISPEAALARAIPEAPTRAAASQYSLLSTIEETTGPAVYIFADGASSLVVSADDSTIPLLGYSDNAAPTRAGSPLHSPAFEYWVRQYAAQIEWMRLHAPSAAIRATRAGDRAPIGPLVSTQWNQDAPYNDLCPMDNGKRSVTGCVATAMAQVLNNYRWFTTGKGSHTYKLPNGTSSTFNFAATTFDWANMLDTYTADATPEQKKAVATLMLACGASVDMNYTSVESGAVAEFIPGALINYFDCDKGVSIEFRDYTPTQQQWDDMVYSQLRDNGPVIYNGSTSTGAGHSFVCDGYADGYFHINWGWGGLDDGMYILSVLDPGDTEGIGGAEGAFAFGQTVVANIGAPKAGSKVKGVYVADTGFYIPVASENLGNVINVQSEVVNWSAMAIPVKFGVIIVDKNGKQYIGEGSAFENDNFKPGYYLDKGYQAQLPNNLANGSYTIYPAFCTDGGEWQIMPAKNGTVSFYYMDVTDGRASFTPQETARAEITNPAFTSPVFANRYATIEAEIKNPTALPFAGDIMLVIIDEEGNQIGSGDKMHVTLEPQQTSKLTYNSTIGFADDFEFTSGTYSFFFYNTSTYTQISDIFTAQVKDASNPELEITSFTFAGNPIHADKGNLVFNVDVKCVKGYLADPLTLILFDGETRRSVLAVDTDPLYLAPRESTSLEITANFPAGKDGAKYIAAMYLGNKSLSNPIYFTLGTSGVDTLTDADEVLSMQVFTAAGVLVASSTDGAADLSALPSGVYILRAVTSSGAVKTRRIIK